LKDLVCRRDERKWIGAVYFPRGQQTFATIRGKFSADAEGIEANNASGIVFVTNQELTLGQREELCESKQGFAVELYHLERITNILDSPICYGMRLDYLDIPMTKEEQLSFIAYRDGAFEDMMAAMHAMEQKLSEDRKST